MSSIQQEYWGREQSLIKHTILKMYLQPAARIIGKSGWKTFTFVDCCSGPWELATDDYRDSSFGTAIRELRAAREYLRSQGVNDVEVRCLFLEQEPEPFAKLKQFCDAITDMEVKPLEGDFTEKTGEILTFIRAGRNPFTFFFIDPTGWKPVVLLNKIAPLLNLRSSEVLINFMTPFIKRFSGPQRIAENIGTDYVRKVAGLSGQELDDAAPMSFADELRNRHFYRYTCTSVVLHPTERRTHYHLIYGTRHITGVNKFKEAEKQCFPLMQTARLGARRRQTGADQQPYFSDEFEPVQDAYSLQLKQHYSAAAFAAIQAQRRSRPLVEDEAWEIASRFPLVWKSDVRQWLKTSKPAAVATSATAQFGRIS